MTFCINSRSTLLTVVCISHITARKSELLTTKFLCTRDLNVNYFKTDWRLLFPKSPQDVKLEKLFPFLVHWVHTTSASSVPHNAVIGGRDTDGTQIYVGRVTHEGDLLPCKVLPSKKVAYVAYNGAEIPKHSFEILVGTGVQWRREKNGRIPPGAFAGGRTSNGETLFIGRGDHNRSQTVGKVHPSHGCLYIGYGLKEISIKEYEVLVGN